MKGLTRICISSLGWSAARTARQDIKFIAVIKIVKEPSVSAEEAPEAGIREFLVNPMEPAILAEVVRRVPDRQKGV